MIRIRAVDLDDDDIADTIRDLHKLTFADAAPLPPEFDTTHWWLAYEGREAVAFAGLQKSSHVPGAGYFSRVGVMPRARGHGLQLRLMRALESKCFKNGWGAVVSDTTDNLHSANNFIESGYHLFAPQWPWSFSNALYWRKYL